MKEMLGKEIITFIPTLQNTFIPSPGILFVLILLPDSVDWMDGPIKNIGDDLKVSKVLVSSFWHYY